MKEMTDVKIKRFDAGDGFFVDIVETEEDVEAWLQHKEYGVAHLMFGVPAKDAHIFLTLVEANLQDYIEIYRETVY